MRARARTYSRPSTPPMMIIIMLTFIFRKSVAFYRWFVIFSSLLLLLLLVHVIWPFCCVHDAWVCVCARMWTGPKSYVWPFSVSHRIHIFVWNMLWTVCLCAIYTLPSNLIPLKIFFLSFLHSSFDFILFNYLVQSITFIYIFLSHITHMLEKQFTATETVAAASALATGLLLLMMMPLSTQCIFLLPLLLRISISSL